MKERIIVYIIQLLIKQLTPELLNKFVIAVLDFVEQHVHGTQSKVDDELVLPLCAVLREVFDTADIK